MISSPKLHRVFPKVKELKSAYFRLFEKIKEERKNTSVYKYVQRYVHKCIIKKGKDRALKAQKSAPFAVELFFNRFQVAFVNSFQFVVFDFHVLIVMALQDGVF